MDAYIISHRGVGGLCLCVCVCVVPAVPASSNLVINNYNGPFPSRPSVAEFLFLHEKVLRRVHISGLAIGSYVRSSAFIPGV